MEQNNPTDDVQMTTEYQVVFKTTLPGSDFEVPETEIQLPGGSTTKDMTQVLMELFEDASAVKNRKFNFMVDNTFLSSTLHDLLSTKLNKSNEQVIEVFYLLALEKPKPKHTSPQDEWISVISPLQHYVNSKAKSYMVGFMNGDIKLFNKEHAECLTVTQMHDSVSSLLYFKSDDIGAQVCVSGSEAPNPALVFSSISADKKHMDILGRGKQSVIDQGGVSHLVQNPMTLEMIASASELGGDIQLWNFKPDTWQVEEATEGSTKRQKTGVKTVVPTGSIKNVSGVTSMKWSTVDSIVCGGNDHQIKIMDVTKQAVQESIFTQHKTMTAVDTSGMMVLAGMEDGLIKVFDLRSQSTKAQSVMEFAAHQKWVSQVKCNPQSENVFLSAGYDGKVKMWDLRNATEPLSTLKRATAGEKDKVFGVAWNGASQILSGGVDSHISVHEM